MTPKAKKSAARIAQRSKWQERVKAAEDAYRNATDPTDRRAKFDAFRSARHVLETLK